MSAERNIILKGIPASGGIAIGSAYIYGKEDFIIYRQRIKEEDIPKEITRFEEALIKTRKEILDLQERLGKQGLEHSKIFDAHLLVLEDRILIEDVITQIKEERFCVEYIFSKVLKKYIDAFSKMKDAYLRERTADISDVGKRILRNLLGRERIKLADLNEPSIVVAPDLSPSDTVSMYRKNILAFVTDIGGKTSHTAILAKAFNIAAVVGTRNATSTIRMNDLLIVDGNEGIVIVNPDTETLQRYQKERSKTLEKTKHLAELRFKEPETRDGRKITVAANIELPSELDSLEEYGAQGIGLFRTEFLFMNKGDFADEDEQFEIYRQAIEKASPYPVIIRTLDLGGDKFVSDIEIPDKVHPFLGWRAIRFCLARPDIFKVQLRALLRASLFGKLHIMFPVVSTVEEIRQAKALIEETKNELAQKGLEVSSDIKIGAMIEVPSAALTSDIIAKEVDFFSIGTNDLVQYTLAVDRVNEKVAYLYRVTHPSVLRLIKLTIDNAHKNGIWVGMCGEMAGEIEHILPLIGLGIDELSVPPAAIPKVKYAIQQITYDFAKDVAKKVLEMNDTDDIDAFLKEQAKPIVESI